MLLLFIGGTSSNSFAQNQEEIIIPGIYAMPELPAQKSKLTQVKKGGVSADLHRFTGFEILPARYLSLPYDTFQHINVKGAFTDVGFVLLLLLPILFLFSNSGANPMTNFLFIGLCSLMLIISIPSALMNTHGHISPTESLAFLAENPQTGILGGWSDAINQTMLSLYTPIHQVFSSLSNDTDFITYPMMILLFLALLFLLYKKMDKVPKMTQAMIYFLAIYFFFWWILGAGAAWYGMLAFCVPFIFLVKGMSSSENIHWKNLQPLLGKAGLLTLVCVTWLFFAFTYRAANYYPADEERAKHLYIPPFTEFQTDNISQNQLQNMLFPNSVAIQKLLNKETESLVYMVGTQLNFFVDKNDSRVFSDTFLDFYSKMVNQFKDKQIILQALKKRGFKYIVFDLNLGSLDQTPNKTLTRKFTNFMNCLYDNPKVELVLTDRTLKKTADGQVVSGVFPVQASIENAGALAVFEIK